AGLYLLPIALTGQRPDPWAALSRPRTRAPEPTQAAITPADLMTRVYLFADDSMGGRILDSRGNVLGVEYIARELARLGLEPAGDSGTFFQSVPVITRVVDPATALAVEGTPLTPWIDFAPRDQGSGARSIDGVPVVYGGTWGIPASLIAPETAAGKLVVLSVAPAGYSGNVPGTANRQAVSEHFAGAAGIAVAGLDLIPPILLGFYREPAQQLAPAEDAPVPGFLYVTRRVAGLLLGANPDSVKAGAAGRPLSGSLRFINLPLQFPARNVVAVLRGGDPVLRDEFVALGAHNDHIGTAERAIAHDSIYVVNHLFRPGGADDPAPRLAPAQAATVNAALAGIRARTNGASARPDSIYNGADDDGSGSMALLEIAEQFAHRGSRPKRSLLFIWHVGEEQGLFGSEHFTDHPGVPREKIVAQLNLDMIGRGGAEDVTGNAAGGSRIRGGPDYLQLIGSRRLSTEFGDLAEQVNQSGDRPMQFDYAMDANGHPQNIYCRSDHWSYARYGIPIIFFSTGGHADYHQVTDEPQYLDYDRLARVTRLVGSLAERVANLGHRVVVDKEVVGPGGACRQ
ncbi:MAG TPA: M28 family peptidase, partial [Gemmatimonadales bacterium]|nr:M28 family peptidase [Gemmatimonadales bacterium]